MIAMAALILRSAIPKGKSLNCRHFSLYSACASSSSAKKDAFKVEDKVTHTGQRWEIDDYRLVRFIDRPKHINTNVAKDLIDSVPPQERKERVVWCDGGGGPTGHPKVYINLDKPGKHICGYCGLRFYKDDKH
ncbi:NADH dehydrogenase [ubiquinone] iron-sulfur protein 6, mitochondrial [Ischnura elegans]|uniref:NADH dehydrogenase [ubiquinone] iron-sulfur protein 6, mitochondrial n=1 Tax=Ischnura elegans TaxID=197161 RepID=UPI001ED89BF2|nr:NADH dehydrogenase [ubiquinone] iron-sulfur protein 6, mitochondrial [Ischnura elegans]